MRENILILDFGGQYTQLIARRIREANVYCEIVPYDIKVEKVKALKPMGIVLSGGPASVYVDNAPMCDKEIFSLNIPVLGICYGAQLMALLMGGNVERAEVAEYGKTDLLVNNNTPLFKGIERDTVCWMSHIDLIDNMPEDFRVIASTQNTPVAAMANVKKKLYAVQFHPEVEHTLLGKDMIRNFLFEVCDMSANWTMDSFVEQTVKSIRKTVGSKNVICALSGGVDSSVAAVLVHRAIGEQLTCIFVDNGLLRLNEADKVEKLFKEKFNINLIRIDAKERFLSKLKGVSEPEAKRKIIGNEFIRIFEEEAKKIQNVEYLVQGTLYPDVIESGNRVASTIKSHHNVGGLPKDMNIKILEPLRSLFKDEVRLVGKELDITEDVLKRHPFPGPGLAVRVLGEITEEKLDLLREVDSIFLRELRSSGYYDKVWQAFAVLPDIKSVGVMGDERTYCYTVALRAVTSTDGMTADWARLPLNLLDDISRCIVNEVKGVNRVVYDITSKPPATIEWE